MSLDNVVADDSVLIDRIYEAAVQPELWPGVLGDLAAVGGGQMAQLLSIVGPSFDWLGSPNANEDMEQYVREGWPVRTNRAQRLLTARHAGFLTDLDVYTREELATEPVYEEFLRPRGLGWGVGTAIPVPSGETIYFAIDRRFDSGPADRACVARLDLLRPHLARGALLTTRLRLDRVRAAVGALEAIGLPAAIIGNQGHPLAMNARCGKLVPSVLQDRSRLTLTNEAADSLLASAIETVLAGRATGVLSIAIPADSHGSTMVLHLLPLRRSSIDIFSGASGIVVITPLDRDGAPDTGLLEGLFDLSPAQAKVARGISESLTLDEIAYKLNLSKETVRTQLRTIFSKTGTRRQSELALLLRSTVLHGGSIR